MRQGMKMNIKTVLLVSALVFGTCLALEREDPQSKGTDSKIEDFDVIQDTTVSSEESEDRNDGKVVPDDSSEKDGGAMENTKCSESVCRLKCQILERCQRSQCLPDGRCKCSCRHAIDPLDAFFRSILSSRLEPRISIMPPSRIRPRFPEFGILPHSSYFPDFSDVFKNLGDAQSSSRILVTMQQTCLDQDSCSAVCSNCTNTRCVDSLCQCTGCNREEIETRSTNVAHTCRSARTCIDHCKGCVKTMCRYGSCECSRCSNVTELAGTTTTEATTTEDLSESTTTSEPLEESSTPFTEILSVRNNQSSPIEAVASGVCIPKKCNHVCWERQCTEWNCVKDQCKCDGCPEEIAVIVQDSTDEKKQKPAGDNNKYDIIF